MPGHVEHTLEVLDILATTYSKPEFEGTVVGIELLNERMYHRGWIGTVGVIY